MGGTVASTTLLGRVWQGKIMLHDETEFYLFQTRRRVHPPEVKSVRQLKLYSEEADKKVEQKVEVGALRTKIS